MGQERVVQKLGCKTRPTVGTERPRKQEDLTPYLPSNMGSCSLFDFLLALEPWEACHAESPEVVALFFAMLLLQPPSSRILSGGRESRHGPGGLQPELSTLSR